MQPRILYPARISFKIEGEIKIFLNKQKLKEYSNTKPRLKEIFKPIRKEGKGRKKKRKKKRRRGRTRTEETTIREQSRK